MVGSNVAKSFSKQYLKNFEWFDTALNRKIKSNIARQG